jgi:hypothetical protein
MLMSSWLVYCLRLTPGKSYLYCLLPSGTPDTLQEMLLLDS